MKLSALPSTDDPGNWPCIDLVDLDTDNHDHVETVHIFDKDADDDRERAEDLARVFTESPNMLNALKELTHRTEEFLSGGLVTFPAALIPQCRAIIAKAEGES